METTQILVAVDDKESVLVSHSTDMCRTKLRIRAYPFAPDDFKIFSINSNGLEAPASTEHQKIFEDLQENRLLHRSPAPGYTLCLQTLVPRIEAPWFSLELPQYGSRYVLHSADGVTQFLFEPINRFTNFHGKSVQTNSMGPVKFAPYSNEFFTGKLEPLPWSLLNLFSYLYPFDWSSVCMKKSPHGHFMVNIFFEINKNILGLNSPANKSTAYAICDDTPLRVVFEMLAGEKLDGKFTLGQIVYEDEEMTKVKGLLKPYTYEQAWQEGVEMKDLSWIAVRKNELHLWSSTGQQSLETPLGAI